jgi:hypothetical protein
MGKEILPLRNSNDKINKSVYEDTSMLESNGYVESIVIPILESDYKKFIEKNESILISNEYWKEKIEELKYRLNPPFTLSIIKNRQSNKSIVAKVKWIYKFKGEYKKNPYISVYIGSLEQYPKGLADSKLFYDVPKKIQEYLDKICPRHINPIE